MALHAYLNRVFSYVDQNIQIKDSYMYVVSLGWIKFFDTGKKNLILDFTHPPWPAVSVGSIACFPFK